MAESDFIPEEQKPRGPGKPVRRRQLDDEDRDRDDKIARRIRKQDDDAISVLIPYRNGWALAAYYVGVFSLIPCAALVLGPMALAFGIIGLRRVNRHPEAGGTGHAIAGIVLGALTSLANWGVAIVGLVSILNSK